MWSFANLPKFLIYFGVRMHAKIGDIFLIPMMITGKLLIITAKKELIKLILSVHFILLANGRISSSNWYLEKLIGFRLLK